MILAQQTSSFSGLPLKSLFFAFAARSSEVPGDFRAISNGLSEAKQLTDSEASFFDENERIKIARNCCKKRLDCSR